MNACCPASFLSTQAVVRTQHAELLIFYDITRSFFTTLIEVGVVVVEQWVPATLTGGVRLLFGKGDQIPVWPMYLVPGIGVVALSLLTIRGGSRIGFLKGSILSALCSLICGTFGWVFDFTLLLPGYLFCALQPLGAKPHLRVGKRALLLPLLLVNVAGWVSYRFLVDHHLYMWFPPAMLLATLPWALSEDWARIEGEI